MTEIIAVIIGFILSGLIGNALLQQWQHRSWMRQQKFLGAEKEYQALVELSNEVSSTLSRRIYKSRRLLWAVRSLSDDYVEDRLREYDSSLVEWNEKLTSMYVRLTIYADYYDRWELDSYFQEPLQQVGIKLEAAVRARRSGKTPNYSDLYEAEKSLEHIHARSLNFTRGLLKQVVEVRENIYDGRALAYTASNLEKYSTWELIHALFVTRVDSHSVLRTPADPR